MLVSRYAEMHDMLDIPVRTRSGVRWGYFLYVDRVRMVGVSDYQAIRRALGH